MEEVHETTGSMGLLLCLRETRLFGSESGGLGGEESWVGVGVYAGMFIVQNTVCLMSESN